MSNIFTAQLVKSAKYALDMKCYEGCLGLIELFEKDNVVDEIFEIKIECFFHLKYFSKILDAKGPISDNFLYYKCIAFFEMKNFDDAVKCINSVLGKLKSDKFIQLFHSYLNPFENFQLFWKYLDPESKKILSSQMDYGTVATDFRKLKKGDTIRSYSIDDATLEDFIKLVQKESIDLSCLSGDGSYNSGFTTYSWLKINNLGFLKYFSNLKIINLRGQDKVTSSWGINYNYSLRLVNLSDIPQIKSELIVKAVQAINSNICFYEDDEFRKAERKLSPLWVSINNIVLYHNFLNEKLKTQKFPKIFIPKCYFEDNKLFKVKLNPTFSLFNYGVKNTIGKSEKYFEKYLINEFQNKILTNQSLLLHKLYNPLYPDFVYRDDNVLIDIEIDEPYIYSTKLPSHFHEYDEDRNYKFLERDWFIIRFSEEQVVNHPQDCISFLKIFIRNIEEGKVNELINNKENERIAHKSWKIGDCIKLAETSYRDSYITNLNG